MRIIKVVSGFPGVGKSYYVEHTTKRVLDSDSSKFSWVGDGERNPDFPHNYMEHIQKAVLEVDLVLVSTHKIVRAALVDHGIPFVLVYPDRRLKEEYLGRFKSRGSSDPFVQFLDNNWDTYMAEMDEQEGCNKVILKENQYLSDVLDWSFDA